MTKWRSASIWSGPTANMTQSRFYRFECHPLVSFRNLPSLLLSIWGGGPTYLLVFSETLWSACHQWWCCNWSWLKEKKSSHSAFLLLQFSIVFYRMAVTGVEEEEISFYILHRILDRITKQLFAWPLTNERIQELQSREDHKSRETKGALYQWLITVWSW